jgi:hypothetical protein
LLTGAEDTVDGSPPELKFLDSIEKCGDPEDFQARIRKSLNGIFVELADKKRMPTRYSQSGFLGIRGVHSHIFFALNLSSTFD